jgi:O-antigen/teichoic acid export membrane protein
VKVFSPRPGIRDELTILLPSWHRLRGGGIDATASDLTACLRLAVTRRYRPGLRLPRVVRFSALLPAFLARRLTGRATLQQALDNSAWLFVDQLVRMAAGLLVGVWIARYLGPEQYGWLNYAAAVIGTIGVLTSLGLNAVVVREIAREPAAAGVWMGAAFLLKSLGGAVGFLLCVGAAWLQPAAMSATRPLIVIVGLGLFFQGLDIYDLFFQAKGTSRISAWVRIVACVLANLLKVGLILGNASLAALAATATVELAISGAGWIFAGRTTGHPLGSLRVERARVLTLLRESWPLALSGLALYVQAYADQLVIGIFLGGVELGEYSAALRLVAVFGFVPMVLQTVAAPEITRAKRDDERLYRRRLHNFYRLMFVMFVLTAVPLIIFGPWVVTRLFGASYVGAAALLPLLAFRLFFSNLGVARSVFITNEGLFHFALLTAIVGALVNLLFNVWWVPQWGARGAILASFVSFGVTTFGLEVFHPAARANLGVMLRAIFLPWRPFTG